MTLPNVAVSKFGSSDGQSWRGAKNLKGLSKSASGAFIALYGLGVLPLRDSRFSTFALSRQQILFILALYAIQ
ncbi:MAG: hypothetical protein AAF483_20045 [Planctomycetota bacterium]